jgi:hypothetical protein
MRAICYVVEAMARSQYLQLALFLYVTPHLFERSGGVQAVCAVFEIARPILQFVF